MKTKKKTASKPKPTRTKSKAKTATPSKAKAVAPRKAKTAASKKSVKSVASKAKVAAPRKAAPAAPPRPAAASTEMRRNLSLRRALDTAHDALIRRDAARARTAITKAGAQGPMAVRPTRLLWEVVERWLRLAKKSGGGDIDVLFIDAALPDLLKKSQSKAEGNDFDGAYELLRQALTLCPLSPEAVFRMGQVQACRDEASEARLWFKLVPDILGPDRRRGPVTRRLVADSLFALSRLDLARGHRSRAAKNALAALDADPTHADARAFIWDLERSPGA